jgi:uncharacterized LabA/DUF88 family protein
MSFNGSRTVEVAPDPEGCEGGFFAFSPHNFFLFPPPGKLGTQGFSLCGSPVPMYKNQRAIWDKVYNKYMPDEQITSISRHKIAILIDGDNAQASLLSQMLVEAGKYGLVTLRRIYGDWTTNSMNSWKDVLNFHAVQPIQQFRYTVGKNATDSAMIIDAMDILHSGVVDGFCLVSSDSDYTRLATRIRETGVFAMGIGEKKTPKPFVNACDVFVYTENLVTEEKNSKTKSRKSQEKITVDQEPIPLLRKAFEMSVQEDGWSLLAVMGNALYQLDPGFDPRTYGHKQLSRLIGSYKEIFEQRSVETNGSTLFYVKMKE